jgi:hypothetical protein
MPGSCSYRGPNRRPNEASVGVRQGPESHEEPVGEPADSSHQGHSSQDGGAGVREGLALYPAESPTWRKSSYSGYNGDCVEVAVLSPGQVGVRDSKAHGSGPVLRLSSTDWAAFLAVVRAGTLGLG